MMTPEQRVLAFWTRNKETIEVERPDYYNSWFELRFKKDQLHQLEALVRQAQLAEVEAALEAASSMNNTWDHLAKRKKELQS